jgi:ankyrin repeat protein
MNERAFLDSIFNGNIDKVKEVIENNKDLELNFINKELNITPLICAIDAINPEIVELLLNNGSNPNFMHTGLSLPLYHAVELAEEAADYDEADDPKLLGIIELLIKNGADVHLTNYNGKSPYQYAESRYFSAKKIFDLNR